MISIVRIFGAPVTDPHGKSARMRSTTPIVDAGGSCASIVEVSCHTVG